MNPIRLNLPDDLWNFVVDEATTGNFSGPASYIEALIARAKAAKANIDVLVMDGLESGEPIPLNSDEWARIRSDVKRRLR